MEVWRLARSRGVVLWGVLGSVLFSGKAVILWVPKSKILPDSQDRPILDPMPSKVVGSDSRPRLIITGGPVGQRNHEFEKQVRMHPLDRTVRHHHWPISECPGPALHQRPATSTVRDNLAGQLPAVQCMTTCHLTHGLDCCGRLDSRQEHVGHPGT
ncbi:hypothetical protein N7539_000222 [Penicillium diatomitis]|uniref:Uncharacterized protein n=1 Tax=Penicillium diatomitis TaxID=2819901 RepID=A0A9W9XLC7_9EURO|nr:uncharacterized protein N7539_000222 [Penicillium diatomitis]KAJ5495106.1 hypothetical protein N7539_000222 [Penicillium diatomitis]